MIRFGIHPSLIQTSVPVHKMLLVLTVVSMLSHPVISRSRLYEVIQGSGLWRGAPMMQSKTYPVVYGTEYIVVLPAKTPCTASMQKGLERKHPFRLMVEIM